MRPSKAARRSAGYSTGYFGTYARDVIAAKGGTSGFVDYNVYQNIGNDNTMVHLIATIAQGTTTQERIGRKCKLNSVQFRGYVRSSLNTAAARSQVAIALIYDMRPTGTLPTAAEILETADPIALNNENGFDRFKIIKRWDFAILGNEFAPNDGALTDRSNKQMNHFVKLGKRGKRACYGVDAAGVAGSIAGIKEGALYLLVLSDKASASTYCPVAVFNTRTRFTDILS